jgi:hypothetical protein
MSATAARAGKARKTAGWIARGGTESARCRTLRGMSGARRRPTPILRLPSSRRSRRSSKLRQRSAVECRLNSIASASTSGSGMPVWCERAAPLPRSPAQVTCASMGRASMPRAALVRIGDVITVALERTVRVLKVKGFTERRGPAKACDGLYEEMV